MLTEIRLEQIKDHAIVFAVVLEHRFTNRAFEIKANHGKRRKEEEKEEGEEGDNGLSMEQSRFRLRADFSIRKPV